MPTLRELEYLVAVSETRHFSRAAERVYVTQPTLSDNCAPSISAWAPSSWSAPGSAVVVTPIGTEVVEIGRRMLRDAQRIRDCTGNIGQGLAGVVRIGLPSTVGPYLLPRVVPTLHARYPKLKLYVREDLPPALPRGLAEGLHDVIVAPSQIAHHGFREATLFDEPLYLAVPLDPRTCACEAHCFTRPVRHRPFGAGARSSTARSGGQSCGGGRGHLRFDYKGTSLDTLREMMATGLGVSILPALYVRAVLRNDRRFRIFTIADRNLKRTIAMYWRNSKASQTNFERLATLFRRRSSMRKASLECPSSLHATPPEPHDGHAF